MSPTLLRKAVKERIENLRKSARIRRRFHADGRRWKNAKNQRKSARKKSAKICEKIKKISRRWAQIKERKKSAQISEKEKILL